MSDRLFDLLPAIVRLKDSEQGWPLRALLRVIAEQVDIVEADIYQLYDNWFIETAQDWAIPYIGELVGYSPVHEAGKPGDIATAQGRARNRILVPRREVANTIRHRRRKGTLALLELLAHDAAGWPARAVEFYRLLSVRQNLNMLHTRRGRIVDMRWGDALDLVDGPFDRLMHTAEMRRIGRTRDQGRYNVPNVGLFVWRLRSYPVTHAPAHAAEDVGPHAFTFSALGNDTVLFHLPQREPSSTSIAQERNLPGPIRRRLLESSPDDIYGDQASFAIWTGSPPQPVPVEAIVAADLSDWIYRPVRGQVAVDPVLGRVAFPPGHAPKRGVRVSYRYGFSMDMGGGEYARTVSNAPDASRYSVGADQTFQTISDALDQWREDRPRDAVIEIVGSGIFAEQIEVELEPGSSLQIRAASGSRPVLRLLDWRTDRSDALLVSGGAESRFTLDGLVVTGRGLQVDGDVACVLVRHSTLVPGWGLEPDCRPRRPNEASIVLVNTNARVDVEHSIVGSILVIRDEVKNDPERISVTDSILDATNASLDAVTGPEGLGAHAVMTFVRSTIIGEVLTHAVDLAENSIFVSHVQVARRQRGCMRFCYVPPASRTPRRYQCQPDLVEAAVREAAIRGSFQGDDPQREAEREAERVRPTFTSMRYGNPAYCQLGRTCAVEITAGADDESELGAFHDLFQPQRAANLRVRLSEYSPAGMESGIVFVT